MACKRNDTGSSSGSTTYRKFVGPSIWIPLNLPFNRRIPHLFTFKDQDRHPNEKDPQQWFNSINAICVTAPVSTVPVPIESVFDDLLDPDPDPVYGT